IARAAVDRDHRDLPFGRPDDLEALADELRVKLFDGLTPLADEQSACRDDLDMQPVQEIPERMTSRAQNTNQAAILDEETALVFGNHVNLTHFAGPPLFFL